MFSSSLPRSLQNCVIENIQLGRQIGYGANGRILEAKWEGATVAIKEIHSIFNQVSEPEFQAFKQSFLKECEQSNQLRHPNIVRFFGIYLPPDARLPSLVMERLHCSLNNLLEQSPVIPIGTKLSILHDVSLGIRFLHSHNPPIIHCDLSSNNVLLTKGTEAKIGDLGTARLVDPRRQSLMTKAPGTVDFMPPEALAAKPQSVRYGRELDVFSFGCVMLHTLSHQWPTPSEPEITDSVTFERSEVQRRSQYFSRIDGRLAVLIPLIKSCLDNLSKNRTSIVTICEQLDGLVDRELDSIYDVDLLRQEIERKDIIICDKDMQIEAKDGEIQRKDAELHNKDVEIEGLKSDLSKLRTTASHLTHKQVSNTNTEFWNSLKRTWQQNADMSVKCWANSIALLDNKVYITPYGDGGGYPNPLMYDTDRDEWSLLPKLSQDYVGFCLVAVPGKKQLLAIGGANSLSRSNKVFLWDEKSRKWLTPYPDMSTARCYCSGISHGSSVIVAGGIVSFHPLNFTSSVEVLHIREGGLFSRTYWSTHETIKLPYGVAGSIALIIDDKLYIAGGTGDAENQGFDPSRGVITASLPQLLQSGNNTNSGQVWNKLPVMPCVSHSINHYQGCLIAFSGITRQVEHPSPVYKFVPLVHLYNPSTKCWDCVGDSDYPYNLGRSVHIGENKILFIGGSTGTHDLMRKADLVKSCITLTINT